MTDNFEQISKYIESFPPMKDMFFHISVMIRHKDVEWFPDGKNNNARTIYSVNVSSAQELNDQKKLISTMCDALNARAYINLSPKSYPAAAAIALENATHSYVTKNYKGLQNSWSKGVAKASIKKYILYLVDIDEPDKPRVNEIIKYLNGELRPSGDKVVLQVPSRTGIHLICRKFDTKNFEEKFPGIDVKKNSMTILYSF